MTIFSCVIAQDGSNDPTFNPYDTGHANGTDGVIGSVALQSDGKLILGGYFKHYTGQVVNNITRINEDETFDETFDAGLGANNSINKVLIQPDGKILVGGTFTSFNGLELRGIVRLNINGSLDENFNIGVGANNSVSSIEVQPDGKIIVVGDFTSFNGVNCNRVVRLNSDGSVDTSFSTGSGANAQVRGIAIQDNGKILLIGGFSTFNGIQRNRTVRLNTNGTIDNTFLNTTFSISSSLLCITIGNEGKIYVAGAGIPNVVRLNTNGTVDNEFLGINGFLILDIIVQPDGKILTFGTSMDRYNADGSIDDDFIAVQPDGQVYSGALKPDGKIVAAGWFLTYNNYSENCIVLLNNDGSRDNSFDMGGGTGADNTIFSITKQSDGKIFITGRFDHYNGVPRSKIARITEDGLLDESFDPGLGANGVISVSALTSDQKLIIAGDFTTYNGAIVNGIARINGDGSLDTSFNTGSGFSTQFSQTQIFSKIIIQEDNKIVLTGNFNQYNGAEHILICRLNIDGSIDETFNTDLMPFYTYNHTISSIAQTQNGGFVIAANTPNSLTQTTLYKINSDGSPVDGFEGIDSDLIRVAHDIVVQPDNKILISGRNSDFPFVYHFIRLNPNGSIDTGFNTDIAEVYKIILQDDGKIIVAGINSMYDSITARINPDGSTDSTFDVGTGFTESYFSNTITDYIKQQDKIIMAGGFTSYDGAGRNRLVRINSMGSLSNNNYTHSKDQKVLIYKESNALSINSVNTPIAEIKIYDITGRLVYEVNGIGNNIHLTENINQNNAVLIVNVTLTDNSKITQKVLY